MSVIVDNLTGLIGNTPLLRPNTFKRLAKIKETDLLFKLEYLNCKSSGEYRKNNSSYFTGYRGTLSFH